MATAKNNAGATAKTGRTAKLLAEAQKLAEPPAPVSHEQLITALLGQVGKVDFYTLADLENPDEKLKQKHFFVLIVEHLLHLAAQNSWGLCRRDGFVYTYNGAYWRHLEKDSLQRFLMQAAEKMGLMKLEARSHFVGEQLLKQFLTSAHLPAPAPDRALVRANLRNGTFEVGPETQQLRPPNPADFLTHQLPFAYDESAAAPRWQAFLDRVLPDTASQHVLAEYLGYVFVAPSQLKLEKVLLLYGSGANGKSVVFEVVTALLGPDNTASYSLSSLTSEESYSRAKLANVLVNYASEMPKGLESNYFKQLASGEPVQARLPYGQPFIMTDYAKLIFNCNELPTEVEQTNAFFRRFLIVPFAVTIPEAEQDKTLAGNIIKNELAGVFNWMLAGLRRVLAQQGFTDCEAARQQLELYRLQSDTVRLFLEENGYTASPDAYSPTAEVYGEYRQYCIDFGNTRPVARLKFVARLSAVGIAEHRRNVGRVLYLSRAL